MQRTPRILGVLVLPWIAYACSSAPLASSSSASSASSSASSTSGTGGASTGTGGALPDAGDAGDAASVSDASDASCTCDASEGFPTVDAACGTRVTAYPLVAGVHIPLCTPETYTSNPPTSGPHYPIWAAYKTYSVPVERQFYVHDEEHGAVVIAYNCPSGCSDELSQLAAFLAARPADPLCVEPVRARIVVTPDPLLDTRFAAAAWGWALTSQCFDLEALGAFIDAHYAMGPENFCSDGVDVTAPDSGLPAGCGQATVDGG